MGEELGRPARDAGADTPMNIGERWRHDTKPDAQAFDRVEIVTVPRYKTSGLSGDEWRISGSIRFYRKGRLVHEVGTRNVASACHHIGWHHDSAIDNGKGYFAGEPVACDQEGCAEPPTVWYRKIADYERSSGVRSELTQPTYRQFCDRHKTRGDCGLDDADDNYVQMEGPPCQPKS